MRNSLAALLALSLAACASTQTSGPTLPPDLQRVLDDYSAAWAARNVAGIASLFPDNRIVAPNACPPARSRAEVQACYAGSGGPIDLRALDHRFDGSLAYIIGEYANAPGQPAAGKFVLTLEQDASGRWLIIADMDRPYQRPANPAQ